MDFGLYVGGIPKHMGKVEIEKLFNKIGKVISCTIMYVNKGSETYWGFVNFATLKECQDAIDKYHGFILEKDYPLCVNISDKTKMRISNDRTKESSVANGNGKDVSDGKNKNKKAQPNTSTLNEKINPPKNDIEMDNVSSSYNIDAGKAAAMPTTKLQKLKKPPPEKNLKAIPSPQSIAGADKSNPTAPVTPEAPPSPPKLLGDPDTPVHTSDSKTPKYGLLRNSGSNPPEPRPQNGLATPTPSTYPEALANGDGGAGSTTFQRALSTTVVGSKELSGSKDMFPCSTEVSSSSSQFDTSRLFNPFRIRYTEPSGDSRANSRIENQPASDHKMSRLPSLKVNLCFECGKPAIYTSECCNSISFCNHLCLYNGWAKHKAFCPTTSTVPKPNQNYVPLLDDNPRPEQETLDHCDEIIKNANNTRVKKVKAVTDVSDSDLSPSTFPVYTATPKEKMPSTSTSSPVAPHPTAPSPDSKVFKKVASQFRLVNIRSAPPTHSNAPAQPNPRALGSTSCSDPVLNIVTSGVNDHLRRVRTLADEIAILSPWPNCNTAPISHKKCDTSVPEKFTSSVEGPHPHGQNFKPGKNVGNGANSLNHQSLPPKGFKACEPQVCPGSKIGISGNWDNYVEDELDDQWAL